MAYTLTKKQISDGVNECNGTYRDLAKKLKIKNGLTAKKHLEKHPDLIELFREKQEELVDIAENALIECLTCDSPSVKAAVAQFVLKSIAKDRWGDKVDDNTQEKLVDLVNKLIDNAKDN